MKLVAFNRAVKSGNYDLYSCDAGEGDHSGVYVQREVADDAIAELKKLGTWLTRLAEASAKQAAGTRHDTVREACEADAKNYRASAKKALRLVAEYEAK